MTLRATGIDYAWTEDDEARAKLMREKGYEEKSSYDVGMAMPDCAVCGGIAARCPHPCHHIFSATRGEDGWPNYIRHVKPDVPFEVYTDGSGASASAPAGSGAVLVRAGVVLAEARKGFETGTNNLAECRAIHLGLWLLRAHARSLGAEGHNVSGCLYSDSQFALEATRPGCMWNLKRYEKDKKTEKMSTRAALECRALREKMPRVEFHWVRGHAGNAHNERADALASGARLAIVAAQQDAHRRAMESKR